MASWSLGEPHLTCIRRPTHPRDDAESNCRDQWHQMHSSPSQAMIGLELPSPARLIFSPLIQTVKWSFVKIRTDSYCNLGDQSCQALGVNIY
jgi:hypothetical protein